ncbi:ribosomal protein [Musa troglodytarum]|uniref:Ribosomal protein n=1 Tax=Musa troglodytarum TaxID=320322 RepID=A0A9E7F3S1_9LILI|nr:ribosomal protein [Musa troglodytarum]
MGQREEGGEREICLEGKPSLLLLPLEEDLPLPLEEDTTVVVIVVVCRREELYHHEKHSGATFECLMKTYGFLTPDFWTETRYSRSPFQEYTDLLAKPTKAILLENTEKKSLESRR